MHWPAAFGTVGFNRFYQRQPAAEPNRQHRIVLDLAVHLQALAGSAATVVVPGIIRAIYQEHTAKGMSYVSMSYDAGPFVSTRYWHPGVVSVTPSWQWICGVGAVAGDFVVFGKISAGNNQQSTAQ